METDQQAVSSPNQNEGNRDLNESKIDSDRKLINEEQNQLQIEANLKKERDTINLLKEESESMWLTDQFVMKPCSVLIIGYIVLILLTYASVQLEFFEISDSSNRDFFIWKDKMTVDLDMFNIAVEYMDEKFGSSTQGVRSQNTFPLFILYTNTNPDNENGLLDKDILLNMMKIEEKVRNHPDYGKHCMAQNQYNETCGENSYLSALNVPEKMNMTKSIKDMSQSEINRMFKAAFENEDVFNDIEQNFDQNTTSKNMAPQYMRAIFMMGGPLEINGKRYDNKTDLKEEQEEHSKVFARKIKKLVETTYGDAEKFGCRVDFAGVILSLELFLALVIQDLLFAVISVVFVFCYFVFHLKSKFLAFIGTTIILFSFPITVIFTEGIGGVTYIGGLHIVAVYMVLGIAADDIFVFIDAWRRSATLYPEIFKGSKRKRMAYAFRSSSRAMAITSSTTSVAFFANIFSPLLPIKSFGIFAGVIIPINFILVVMFMPSASIIYEEYIEDSDFLCFKWNNQVEDGEENYPKATQQTFDDIEMEEINRTKKLEEEKEKEEEQNQTQKLNKVEEFFDVKLNNFVYKYRIVITAVSFLWFLFALQTALNIGPQTEVEEFIDPEHPVMVVYTRFLNNFTSAENAKSKVHIYWGLIDIDRTGESQWDPIFIGEPVWDTSLDPTTIEAQNFMIKLCDDLEKQDYLSYDSMECWMKDFKKYVEVELERTWPISSNKGFMTYLYKWIGDEYNDNEGAQYMIKKAFGIKNGDIIFQQILAKTDVPRWQSGELKYENYVQWQNFTETWNRRAPEEMGNIKQTSELWPSIKTEDALVQNAIQGVIIAIIFSFIILLYATGNFIQSVVSIYCVTIVIVSIMTILHLNGQKLGTAESISIVVLIGFSVDYIVHLSADYMHSAQIRRFDKMRQAYREMGVSILSGCITTFGCGSCLFFGNFTFFKKFGLVITSTIIIAFIVAMLTFGALCHIMGPEKGFGGIFGWCKKEVSKFQEKQAKKDMVKIVKGINQSSNENIDQMWQKLSQAEDLSETEMNKLDQELDQVAQEMKEESQQIKNLLKGILEEARQRVGQAPPENKDSYPTAVNTDHQTKLY